MSLALFPATSAAQPHVAAHPSPQTSATSISAEYITWMTIVYNQVPPVPLRPDLSSSAVAPDGKYTLSWVELPSRLASTYTLQEAVDPAFTSGVRDICTTTGLACAAQQTMVGARYYRVRGLNQWGNGEWSDTSVVTVSIRGEFLINTQSRQASLAFYQTNYLMAASPDIGWTGNHGDCSPGSTSQAFRDAILRRINYFRAMAGVPADIAFSADANRLAQAAALMMSDNNKMSHNPDPPQDWTCYSDDGKAGAGSSNLFLGVYGWDAITGYVQDLDSGNYAVGHRRWILYPQTQIMGTGDIPPTTYRKANALVVFDEHMWEARPVTRDGFVAWPPPGFVPYQVVFARWSFSYAQADFSAATVTMVSGGVNVPPSQAQVVNGYGENSLVWIPLGMNDGSPWPAPSDDTAYTVTILNVILGGQSRDFTYKVTIFNPDTTLPAGVQDLGEWAPLTAPLP